MIVPLRSLTSRAGGFAPALAAIAAIFAIASAPTTAAFAQSFTKISGVEPVTAVQSSRSVNWVDTDGDGDLDLYFTSGGSLHENNESYRNDGGGSFAGQPSSPIALDSLRADGSTWGDYDNDGDPDLFVVSWYGELNALYRNEGAGSYQRILTGAAATTGTYSEGCAWVDYDADGDLDLYVANSGNGSPGPEQDNLLYRNDGGVFSPVSGEPLVGEGATSRQASWADYDNDGDVDMFLANESGENNRLFRNQLVETGTATFEDLSLPPVTTDGGDSWSGSWGDFDNDGDLDLVVANWSGTNNFLYRNELVETGTATFFKITDQRPAQNTGWTTSSAWADWDNDADLDLVLTNGRPAGIFRHKNFFYRNDGGVLNRDKSSVAESDSLWSYGAAWGDYDGDGDLDLAVANWFGTGEENLLYRNEAQANGNHWLRIRCTGVTSNRSGIGCRITVTATVGGSPVTQIREITGSDGYCSQLLEAHFGLADATTATTVTVRWPSGAVQTLNDVPADQLLEIVESVGVGAVEGPGGSPAWARLAPPAPNPFRGATALDWVLARPANARLLVVDAAGRRVRALFDGPVAAGARRVVWDGRDDSGRPAAGGVYFVRLESSGEPAATQRVVRIR